MVWLVVALPLASVVAGITLLVIAARSGSTDAVADREDTVGVYPRAVYEDGAGRAVVESVTITGMGHGQPVDPGTGEGQCGREGAYLLDVNVCAAYHLGRTWGLS